MSRFAETALDLLWAAGETFMDKLKHLSSSLVEDDEYVLVFVLFLGVPAVIVLVLIGRVVRRTHNRVRYATEYVEQNPDAFVTSSSSSDAESSSDEDLNGNRTRPSTQYSMEEVVNVAARLTEQETQQRRAKRRAAAAAAAAAAANAIEEAPTAATAPTQATSSDSAEKKNQ